jgi:putative restriction endonuclease
MLAMRGFVGVTDQHWYDFLHSHPDQTEVNFWRPKDKNRFGAISPGELFFFKLKAAAHNRVVGGGVFQDWELMPLSAAWEIFGEGNGAGSFDELRALISTPDRPIGPGDDPEIGCILLRDVRFFEDAGIAGPPPDFARNLVQGRTYDLDAPRYAGYFDMLIAQLTAALPAELGMGLHEGQRTPWQHQGPMFGERVTRVRLGQNGFRAAVFNAYSRRCAITDAKIWPTLQAAHIIPITKNGEHRIDNGLLLRSDVHTMFDRGFLSVTPDYELRVSPQLRKVFGNGEQFYAKAGQAISSPVHHADRPNPEFLAWHLREVFRAS